MICLSQNPNEMNVERANVMSRLVDTSWLTFFVSKFCAIAVFLDAKHCMHDVNKHNNLSWKYHTNGRVHSVATARHVTFAKFLKCAMVPHRDVES